MGCTLGNNMRERERERERKEKTGVGEEVHVVICTCGYSYMKRKNVTFYSNTCIHIEGESERKIERCSVCV